MTETTQRRSLRTAVSATTMGAFGVSAVIHLLVFLVIGSVVVFESPLVTEFFSYQEGPVESESLESEPVLLEEEQPLPEFASVETVTEEGGTVEDEAATPIDLIISNVPASTMTTFALPRNVGSPTGTLFGSKSSGEGDGLGGTGKAVTGRLFGKTIESSNLGVVLDVSGSAHSHLDKAITEIDKSFPSAHMVLVIGCGMSDGVTTQEVIGNQRVVPGSPRIHEFSQIHKEDDVNPFKRSVPGQLEMFYSKIGGGERAEEFRKYFKRRNNLYVLYGGDIKAANFAFDFLLERNADAIYWFADFADPIDPEIRQDLTKRLKRNRTKVIAHNFLGHKMRDDVAEMADETDGTTLSVVPGSN